jgi:acetyl-CoA acetyltransferase
MSDIYVVGVGMTAFGRLLEKSVYDMVRPTLAPRITGP